MTTTMQQHHPVMYRQGRHQVQGPQQEVMWNDGTAVTIHPVTLASGQGPAAASPYLRAARLPDGGWVIFNLLQLCPQIEPELSTLRPRDAAAAVHHALRHTFSSAGAMRRAARDASVHREAA
jgi:hypothetical protein